MESYYPGELVTLVMLSLVLCEAQLKWYPMKFL